jgi:hypothetical protein
MLTDVRRYMSAIHNHTVDATFIQLRLIFKLAQVIEVLSMRDTKFLGT